MKNFDKFCTRVFPKAGVPPANYSKTQLKKMQDAKSGFQVEKQMLSPRELELFMRRLRYIITRPTPIHAK